MPRRLPHSRLLRPLLRLALLSVLLGSFPPAPPATPAMVSDPVPAAPPAATIASAAPADPHPAAPAPRHADNAPLLARVWPARSPNLGLLPLAFVPNRGQADSAVQYLVRSGSETLFLTADEAVLALPDADRTAAQSVVRLRFVGAKVPTLREGARLPGVFHYLIGNDPSQWRTNLPTYRSVAYTQLYPGIDLDYAGSDGQLKRTYQIAPGADPSTIRWRYQGATAVAVDAVTGDLRISLPSPRADRAGRTLTEQAPVAWQDLAGQRIPVRVRYAVATNGTVSFVLGAYDRTQPLTIDPVLTYSTYLGGGGSDGGDSIVVDAAGNTYITGDTYSSNFPTQNPQRPRSGSQEIFVSKLSADGSTLLYSTYLGNAENDTGYAIASDSAGSIYVTGVVTGGLTIQGGYSSIYVGNSDAYLAKINPLLTGSASLLYSTYLGGSDSDEGNGIAVDSAGNAYVTGYTRSSAFPTRNARQGSTVVDADGTRRATLLFPANVTAVKVLADNTTCR